MDVNKALGNCQFSNGSAAEDSYLTGTKYNRQQKKEGWWGSKLTNHD